MSRITGYVALFIVSFLAFGWLVLLFSAIGLFYAGTVVLSIMASLLASLFFHRLSSRAKSRDLHTLVDNKPLSAHTDSSTRPEKSGLGRNDSNSKFFVFIVILVSLLVSLATCHFATPTVFGGRDQGSIASAAIELSKNHSLKIQSPVAKDLFQKYGPGKSLNFPGFDYTKNGELVSRFPLGYTAYLASAYGLAGLKGIQYANFIPLLLFLVIFWLTLKEFFDGKISLAGFLLAATFSPFLWFSKYALTEIYMLFLVWAGILFLIYYIKQKGAPLLWLSLAFFAFSALTRIEGIVFFLLAAAYILLLQRKGVFPDSKNIRKYLFISIIIIIIIYFYLNLPALTDSAKNLAKAFLPGSTKESAPSVGLYNHLARIFLIYGILPYLILGFAGIAWSFFVSSRAKSRDPEISRLSRLGGIARNDKIVIFFILFPAFFYLLTPQITLDDPWLLRRFVFAVFPALIFYSVYFLNRFFYHKIFLYFTLAVLILANVAVSQRFINLSENRDLLPQVEKLSQKFGSDDLILVDRLATGSGYSLASEPLRTLCGKNAVYFFNADDLKYISQDRYENIYLIASPEEKNPWYADLVRSKKFNIELINNNFLEPSGKKWGLAVNVETQSLVGVWKVK